MKKARIGLANLGESPGHARSMFLEPPLAGLEPITAVATLHATNHQDLRWKRTLDLILVVLVSPLLGALALLIALLIRSVSAGPVLFRQERVGCMGKRFTCFKFRTMFVDADTTSHQRYLTHLMNSNAPMKKMDSCGDPRIIPFGLFLRSSGLDELPQLINVLRGEMSLVGPRPCLPYEYDNYLPWQKERFWTLPGLTGLWQVSGKNRTTFLEMIQFDIAYTRNKSLWLDLRIILKTIPALGAQLRDIRKPKALFGNMSKSPSDGGRVVLGDNHPWTPHRQIEPEQHLVVEACRVDGQEAELMGHGGGGPHSTGGVPKWAAWEA